MTNVLFLNCLLFLHLLNNPVEEEPVLRGGAIVEWEEKAVVEQREEVGHGRGVVQLRSQNLKHCARTD